MWLHKNSTVKSSKETANGFDGTFFSTLRFLCLIGCRENEENFHQTERIQRSAFPCRFMKLNVERQIFVVHRRIGKLVFSDTKQNQITKFRRVANFFIWKEIDCFATFNDTRRSSHFSRIVEWSNNIRGKPRGDCSSRRSRRCRLNEFLQSLKVVRTEFVDISSGKKIFLQPAAAGGAFIVDKDGGRVSLTTWVIPLVIQEFVVVWTRKTSSTRKKTFVQFERVSKLKWNSGSDELLRRK